ncbi:hypothetical protein [Peristeroidobacter soli]|uniref:hypothetical protein n=1 Tax=Peristeroidobacter soli TaxID=2497877 RepID=UPI00101DB39A|nr:hypothetical protein [Peristeroidobacter soli]
MRLAAIAGMALCALMPGRMALAEIDTSDIDWYLMQDMEHALKDLEPVLVVGNFDSARSSAEVLRGGLQYVHDYFVAKGNVEDAVKIAAEGQVTIARVLAALDSKNQEAAITAARDTARNCKACHQIYKP